MMGRVGDLPCVKGSANWRGEKKEDGNRNK
jgi:hypothetical protein